MWVSEYRTSLVTKRLKHLFTRFLVSAILLSLFWGKKPSKLSGEIFTHTGRRILCGKVGDRYCGIFPVTCLDCPLLEYVLRFPHSFNRPTWEVVDVLADSIMDLIYEPGMLAAAVLSGNYLPVNFFRKTEFKRIIAIRVQFYNLLQCCC